MKANPIKKAVWGLLVVGLGLILIGCGGASSNPSEAKSNVGGGGGSGIDEKTQTTGGGTGGVTITNTHSQPKQLGAGDILYLDLSSSSGSLDFKGVDSSAEFALVVANTSSGQGNFSVQISGDLSDAEFDVVKSVEMDSSESESMDEDSNDITESFHEILRLREKELESLEIPVKSFSASKSISKAIDPNAGPSIAEGDVQTFKVLGSLSSSGKVVEVTADAECVGSNIVFYVDQRVTQEMLSDSEVRSLCNQFDATAALEQNLFGSLSDVNNDGKVAVLFTPQVNKLGAAGGGIVTGFFTANDLYPNTASNAASNYMEILYIMVPDPNGTHGPAISKSFALSNLLPSVLPHELQHAISYNSHVFVGKGSSEEPWLNEGLSHIAEDILGQNQENFSRYKLFLRNPSAYSLVTSRSPGLAARGAAYLFLRFLYEQNDDGSKFLKKLVQSSETGVRNIEGAFGGRTNDFDQFGEFFLRWTVALTMTDAGISQDRRFIYQPRVKNSATNQWSGVCMRCTAEDGRGTVLGGVTLKSYTGSQSAVTGPSAARFYKVSQVKDQLSFESGNNGYGYAVLIRTK